MIHADTYIVGDSQGWTYGVSNWPLGKTFYEGDTLVFNYVPLIHNVVIVNEIGFNYCSTLGASGLYASGSDRITLAKGANYFISGFPDQCLLGMKIAVNAN
ncbi:hypothetical protein P8452_65600 [Trifolium repens]|nr:hypothetical protein P8452_65600 [Trifolium repens]